MGYFSNGTEGEHYREEYCYNCAHYPHHDPNARDCPIWEAHMLANYDLCNVKYGNPLNILIPRTDGGIGNEECRMFQRTSLRLPFGEGALQK